MAEQLATATQNAKADAAVDLIDGGAGAGTLKIYSGAQPASANDAASGTLLVTVTLADPAYGSAASGVAALAGTPLSATASAGGTAGWFRVEDSAGATIFDGAVTATGGGGELELDNTSITNGQTVNINSLPYTQPAA